MRNVREVVFSSGLVLKRCQSGRYQGRWVFENPSWLKGGATWAGIIGFETFEEAMAVADELADVCSTAFRARLEASSAEQSFYRKAMALTPMGGV